jgi:hypothetical protein
MSDQVSAIIVSVAKPQTRPNQTRANDTCFSCLQFKLLSGSDKTFTRTANSGNPMISYSCEKCSCIMWVKAEAKPDFRMIRTGTIDDDKVLDGMVPSKELFCSRRPESFAEYPGIVHAEEM